VTKDLYSDGKSKMIKTAEFRFQVEDRLKSKAAITEAIKKYSGYIQSSDLQLQNPLLEEQMTIRVLSVYFEDLLNEIGIQSVYTNYQKILTEDVSKDFVDLESRLRTKREVLKRYEEILRKKTGTIEELLKTEQQIGDLQEEIEAAVSQIHFLTEKVRYSTINLSIYQVVEERVSEVPTGHTTPGNFAKAFFAGWSGLLSALVAITYLWPWLLIVVTVWYLFRRKKWWIVLKPTETK
jgi:hypothetical protein